MAFSSIAFISVFLPVVFLASLALKSNIRLQNACLLAASLLFYAVGDAFKVALLIASAIINGMLAKGLSKTKGKGKKSRVYLLCAVVFNMGMLFGFKYTSFLIQAVNGAFGLGLPVPEIALPLGISFFTFQAMSYVFDVHRGKTEPAERLSTLLLYLCLFPQLIAGPIVKWQQIQPQFEARAQTAQGVARGLRRFIFGLAKKVLLADTLARAAALAFACQGEALSAPLAWLGAVCFTLQIYLDFSGYSDMAIGLGHMFGFTFPENFLSPLCAASMGDFWRRWHITLTDWFREYLYYPLGGSRKGAFCTYRNLMLVFLLTGLWHGANWTFVLWGLFNGFFVALERTALLPAHRFKKPFAHLYTLLVVVLGFVIFRAESLSGALMYLSHMFAFSPLTALQASHFYQAVPPSTLIALAAALPVAFPLAGRARALDRSFVRLASYGASLVLLVLCYASLVASGYHPFIYFRF